MCPVTFKAKTWPCVLLPLVANINNMARKLYKLDEIEDSERSRLINYFNFLPQSKLQRTDFCHLWNGPQKKGYGVTQIYLDLKKGGVYKKKFLLHRLSYFAKTQGNKGFEKEEKLDVSHLCGEKLCANPTHLVYEEHIVNIDRITCHDQGHCKETHSPKCLFKN